MAKRQITPEEQQQQIANAIAQYEASKVLALRGTPSYIVTLSTSAGVTRVRGLDERPLEAILAGLGGSVSEGIPMMVLTGAQNLVNFGVVVARPRDVVSISSYIETYEEALAGTDGTDGSDGLDGEDDGEDEDGEDGEDGDDEAEAPEASAPVLQHPMLGE